MSDKPIAHNIEYGRLRERLRWFVARQVDRSDRFCWADLVTWALPSWRSPKHLWECRSSRECQEQPANCDSCYCGKFRSDPSFVEIFEAFAEYHATPGHLCKRGAKCPSKGTHLDGYGAPDE